MSNKDLRLRESNPFGIGIEAVEMVKFDRSQKIDLLPQFGEFTVFQNMFDSVMRGELLLYDPIGLFVNYPLTGEESIIIRFKKQSGRGTAERGSLGGHFPFGSSQLTSETARTFYFMITNIREIQPDDVARSTTFVLELASEELYESNKSKVSHCYDNQSVSDSAKELFTEYVDLETRERLNENNYYKEFFTDPEENEAIEQKVVIPNLRPFNALNYLKKKALSSDSIKYNAWLFFENFYGYFFTTIQSIIEDQKEFAGEIEEKKYIYNSNFEITDDDNDPTQIDRLISRYNINKRFSANEKLAGGYFRNQTIVINADQHTYDIEEFTDELVDTDGYLYDNRLNTQNYIEDNIRPYNAVPVRGVSEENAPRLIYEIETRSDAMGHNNEFKLERERKSHEQRYLHSLNQIDIHIVIPGDLTHNCGELIYVELPELHGFNNVKEDKYITGLFLVTEVKHTISVGGVASTTLRINKDSLLNEFETENRYGLESGVSTPNRVTFIDPATGQARTEGGE